jgi:hypothetical protein
VRGNENENGIGLCRGIGLGCVGRGKVKGIIKNENGRIGNGKLPFQP